MTETTDTTRVSARCETCIHCADGKFIGFILCLKRPASVSHIGRTAWRWSKQELENLDLNPAAFCGEHEPREVAK